ncbi:hypothetical protein Leryth_003074 [Lithospermum erythrorhizon]|nr:hypothetical protein Leryth_003074 [Lithospermum erythrorhizon]
MWSHLPFDLLSIVFSYLSPNSLACAKSVCHHWHNCTTNTAPPEGRQRHPAWFLAMATRSQGQFCYVHNSIHKSWHKIPLDFIPTSCRLIGSINCIVLLKLTNTTMIQLAVCNPFTRQFRHLPMLNISRTNPAVGIVEFDKSSNLLSNGYRVYVAGGMSEASSGGATYEPSLEMYDSVRKTWEIVGSMPVEFAVRLTVWTPNESVFCNGVLYWVTSARAYTVMSFNIGSNEWGEISVPMADRLEFATLVRRNGKLVLVGGTCNGHYCIWELIKDQEWRVIKEVPFGLAKRFLGGNSTKCVGIDGAIYHYKDLGSGMIVWSEEIKKGKWEWNWIGGCPKMEVHNLAIRGLLLHPNLFPSMF